MPKLILRSKPPAVIKHELKLVKPTLKQVLTINDRKQKFVSSGSDTFNLAMTGDINKAYPLGRIINIVGDYSSGKTLLATELINIFWYVLYKKLGMDIAIGYQDAEFAFDKDLAVKMNVPIKKIQWDYHDTVQGFKKHFLKFLNDNHKKDACLWVVDSLDSLYDKRARAKNEADEDAEAGYEDAQRARFLSAFFRELKGDISKTNCILLIISQIRENIGVTFGPKNKRNGGKALDFYCSQVAWLREIQQLYTGSHKISIGTDNEVLVKKNKVAPPKRKAEFTIMYNYGLDNYSGVINFAVDNKVLVPGKASEEDQEDQEEEEDSGIRGKFGKNKKKRKRKIKGLITWNGKDYKRNELIKHFEYNDDEFEELRTMVQQKWNDIENEVRIERRSKWK